MYNINNMYKGENMNLFLFLLFACEQKEGDTSASDTAVETQTTADEPSEPSQPDEPSSDPVGDPVAGEQIVNASCMGCHSSNPDIENAASMSDEELIALFANGSGGMPPVSLTEQELLDVIAYLRETYGG